MAKLHFYYSAMNAGKTTTLLQASFNYRERGMETLLFTPAFDNRFGHGKITSRIGLESGAVPFGADFDFLAYVKKARPQTPTLKAIMVDEAQFLTKEQVQGLTDIVNQLNIPVLAYGLRSDFLGEPFEGSKYLLAWAEDLVEIKTICHCGRKATMNARVDGAGNMVRHGEQIEIGGNDRYIALCHKHFRSGDAQPILKVA